MNFETIIKLKDITEAVRMKKARVRAIDRKFNLVIMEKKHDYLCEKHTDFVNFVNEKLNELGVLTMQLGDSQDLDRAKEYLWNSIYL